MIFWANINLTLFIKFSTVIGQYLKVIGVKTNGNVESVLSMAFF